VGRVSYGILRVGPGETRSFLDKPFTWAGQQWRTRKKPEGPKHYLMLQTLGKRKLRSSVPVFSRNTNKTRLAAEYRVSN